ncbi:hypothetical protein D3C76_1343860 [compost metagenome]
MQNDPAFAVVQYCVEIVHRLCTRTQFTQIDKQRFRFAEQLQCLIDQMRPQIVPDAATGTAQLAPALTHFRAETIEMRLEINHLTKRAFFQQCLERQKIAVPAAIVEHRQQLAALLRLLLQLLRL